MHNPSAYENNKAIHANRMIHLYLPKVINSMSWNFTGGNILDFGCGPGGTGAKYFLPLAESTNSQMYSVDISPKMVEFASDTFGNAKTHYAAGSLPEKFPFPNVAFDKVFAVNVLHLMKDVKPTLQGIMNILKPGGQFGFINGTLNTLPFKMMSAVARSSLWEQYFKDYFNFGPEWTNYSTKEPEQYFKTLFVDDMGFEQIHFNFTKFEKVEDMDVVEFVDFVVTVTPCIDKLPSELLGKLKEEYRRLLTTMNGIPLDATSFTCDFEFMGGVLQKPLE